MKKMTLIPNANRECPDQTARMRSLIWAFSVRRHTLHWPVIMQAGNERPDPPKLERKFGVNGSEGPSPSGFATPASLS